MADQPILNLYDSDLTRYVVTYYMHLMTPAEREGWRTVMWRAKLRDANPEQMKAMIAGKFVSTDPAVIRLLKDGDQAFFRAVRDRILQEHSDEAFINLCPRCGALARTPTAKQCPKCYHSWRDTHDEANGK